jgi:hypothetical protein
MKTNTISDELTTAETLRNEANRLDIPLVGIFFRENLILDKPGGYIINLDDASGSGSHWTCAYIPKNGIAVGKPKAMISYFDSFGLPAPDEFEKQISGNYKFNPYVIQDINKGYCGSYCIEFLQHMKKGKSYKSFIKQFHENPKKNAKILRRLEKD